MPRIFLPIAIILLSGLLSACTPETDKAPLDQQAKELVEQAAVLLTAEKKKAFPKLMEENSEWYQDDSYVVVLSMKGKMLVHPAMPDLVGKNQKDLTDVNGKAIVKEFIRIAKSPAGADWIEYLWPKPNTTEPVKKRSYVKAVELQGKKKKFKWIVASGYYLDK